tara:strand:- start:598 stop:1359 length:762 start_codon:yes stop_codon:yes gene_type:complete
MGTQKKLLSIITVVKNDAINIEKTIKSIISQKSQDVEYLLIDGKSSDATLQKARKFTYKIDKIISSKDKGIYDAMNTGIKNSSGKYVGFCNSGDVLKKNSLKTITKFLKKDTDILFATVKRNYLGATIIKSGFNLNRLNYNFDFATAHSTGFYIKKNFHNKIGLYDLSFKCSADYDFYLRIFKLKNLKIMSTNHNNIIGEVQSGGFSSTLTPLEHLKEETKIRLKNKQNILLIILIFVNTLTKILAKKLFKKT